MLVLLAPKCLLNVIIHHLRQYTYLIKILSKYNSLSNHPFGLVIGAIVVFDTMLIIVADMGNIELWYGERFQVLLGDTTQLSYKIGLIKAAIDRHMQAYDSGILDVSLTVQPDPEKEYQVIYTPFSS